MESYIYRVINEEIENYIMNVPYIAEAVVKSIKKDGEETALSAAAEGCAIPATPTGDTATPAVGGVKVSWNKVNGAHGYVIWQEVSGGGSVRIRSRNSLSVILSARSAVKDASYPSQAE